jgi:hypothetical protein
VRTERAGLSAARSDTGRAESLFYERVAPTARHSFETEAAIESELKVDGELRAWRKRQRAVTTAPEPM